MELFPSSEVRNSLLQNAIIVSDKTGFVRVKFVGIMVAGGHTIQVLPKIFASSGKDVKVVMLQVIRALRRYANFQPQNRVEVPFLDRGSETTGLNALAIADWLIQDYLTAGIYRRVRDLHQYNAQGSINWRQTIDHVSPVLSRGQVLYLDTVNRSPTNDNMNFISRLHRQLLASASSEFGHLLGYAPLGLDNEPYEAFTVLPDITICRQKINEEMRNVFSDRAIQLLPVLLAAISAFERAKTSQVALYGTSSFYDVWEKVCSLLLGNERDQWTPYIPRPLWTSASGDKQDARTFVPDIVTRIPVGYDEHLLIADAKYYQLSMPPHLYGQPGVNDVAKQLWYEQCLKAPALNRGISTIHNVFILPDPVGRATIWPDGCVQLSGINNETINILRVSGIEALKRFADGSPLDVNSVKSAITGA